MAFKHVDPQELRARMEALVGPATKDTLSSSGFLDYPCPFPGCAGDHFGVCYDPASRFVVGAWSCFKCGASGLGFRSLCLALGRAEQEFAEDPVPQTLPKLRQPFRTDPKEFATVWSLIQKRYLLSTAHQELLLKRGIEADKLPGWFSTPPTQETTAFSRLIGEGPSESAWLTSGGKPSGFVRPGRIVITYPPLPWGSPLFVETYEPGGGRYKTMRPRGISTENVLYYRGAPRRTTLVITEAPLKAEASFQAGVPSLGMLGAGNGRNAVVRAVKHLQETSEFPRKIAIVFDRDVLETSRKPVEAAADRLETALREGLGKDCPEVVRILLPETIPGDKVDVDSFLGFHAVREGLPAARARYRDVVGTPE